MNLSLFTLGIIIPFSVPVPQSTIKLSYCVNPVVSQPAERKITYLVEEQKTDYTLVPIEWEHESAHLHRVDVSVRAIAIK